MEKMKFYVLSLALLIIPISADAQLRFVKRAAFAAAAGRGYHRYNRSRQILRRLEREHRLLRQQTHLEMLQKHSISRPKIVCPKLDLTNKFNGRCCSSLQRSSVCSPKNSRRTHYRIYKRNRHYKRNRR